jgi:hypothetical protein
MSNEKFTTTSDVFVLVPLSKFTEIYNSGYSEKDQFESILYGIVNDLQYRTDRKALAATDMYEALRAMYKEFWAYNNGMSSDKMKAAINKAKAALNKANPQ